MACQDSSVSDGVLVGWMNLVSTLINPREVINCGECGSEDQQVGCREAKARIRVPGFCTLFGFCQSFILFHDYFQCQSQFILFYAGKGWVMIHKWRVKMVRVRSFLMVCFPPNRHRKRLLEWPSLLWMGQMFLNIQCFVDPEYSE